MQGLKTNSKFLENELSPKKKRKEFDEGCGNLNFRSFTIKPKVTENIQSAQLNEQITEYFQNNPSNSIRRATLNLNISRSRIQRVLRRNNFHPYNYVPVQCLTIGDYQKRISFCNTFLRMCRRDCDIPFKILWTDESTFTRSGVFNYHNSHYWSEENPRKVRINSFQHEFKCNVWCGILGDTIVGPYFFEETVNRLTFLNFLTGSFTDMLDNLPLSYVRDIWLQLDGCPAHYSRIVRQWLDRNFPNKWIGRAGSVAWPPRSPDLTSMDFFLWGYLKNYVYEVEIDSLQQLKARIIDGFNQLKKNPRMIRKTTKSVRARCRLCIRNEGGHIENFKQ